MALALLAAAVAIEQGPEVEDVNPAITRAIVRTLQRAERYTPRHSLIWATGNAIERLTTERHTVPSSDMFRHRRRA